MKCVGLVVKFFIVGEHRAAIACADIFRDLKTEAACLAERAHFFAAPFREVGLAGVWLRECFLRPRSLRPRRRRMPRRPGAREECSACFR